MHPKKLWDKSFIYFILYFFCRLNWQKLAHDFCFLKSLFRLRWDWSSLVSHWDHNTKWIPGEKIEFSVHYLECSINCDTECRKHWCWGRWKFWSNGYCFTIRHRLASQHHFWLKIIQSEMKEVATFYSARDMVLISPSLYWMVCIRHKLLQPFYDITMSLDMPMPFCMLFDKYFCSAKPLREATFKINV